MALLLDATPPARRGGADAARLSRQAAEDLLPGLDALAIAVAEERLDLPAAIPQMRLAALEQADRATLWRQALGPVAAAADGEVEAVAEHFVLGAGRSRGWPPSAGPGTTLHGFYGATQEMTHKQPFTYDADHPAVLVGADNGPTPVEFLLHAIAACLTSGLANIAAARGVNLDSVESTVEGDIDLLGILGLSDEVRNGYQQIRVSFKLRGDDPEKLESVVEQSRKRSAVYDVLTNGVPVDISVDAG